jgi:hypothetical protein
MLSQKVCFHQTNILGLLRLLQSTSTINIDHGLPLPIPQSHRFFFQIQRLWLVPRSLVQLHTFLLDHTQPYSKTGIPLTKRNNFTSTKRYFGTPNWNAHTQPTMPYISTLTLPFSLHLQRSSNGTIAQTSSLNTYILLAVCTLLCVLIAYYFVYLHHQLAKVVERQEVGRSELGRRRERRHQEYM